MNVPTTTNIEDIELDVSALDPARAAALWRDHGCFVVRGLMRDYVGQIGDEIERVAQESIAQLDQAKKTVEGWTTPNGALFLPAPAGYSRDKQIMVLPYHYRNSAALLRSAFHPATIPVLEAILGPNVELFGEGQCLYKEPVGGHPKHLHQDGAYFEHRFEGPVAILNYVVDTNLQNGALHVVPGSHRLGMLKHIDTFSHLGLDADEWPWERAVAIEGRAGDSIFFSVKTIHGSKENFSDRPRPVFIHRYRRIDDFVTIGATTTANRAEAEKHVRKMREEPPGFMVAGFRSFDA